MIGEIFYIVIGQYFFVVAIVLKICTVVHGTVSGVDVAMNTYMKNVKVRCALGFPFSRSLLAITIRGF